MQDKLTDGELFKEAMDPKFVRTSIKQSAPYCRVCNGLTPERVGHTSGCPLASIEDMKKEVERARSSEKWARDRAGFWLNEVRKMHGKLAILKAENKILRNRLK